MKGIDGVGDGAGDAVVVRVYGILLRAEDIARDLVQQ